MADKIKKCCLNCAFCSRVRKTYDLEDVQSLEPDERKGDFSFLSGVGGMPNKILKCAYKNSYWDHGHSSRPSQERLNDICVCNGERFYDYRNMGYKLIPALVDKELIRMDKKNYSGLELAR